MGSILSNPQRSSLDDLLNAARSSPADDTSAMAELIRRFEALAIKIALSIQSPEWLRDDLINAARMGLVDAVRHHDGRPGFPAFARTYMHGAALRELGRWIRPEAAHIDQLDDLQVGRAEPPELEALEERLSPWGAGPLALVVDNMRDDQRRILEMRYQWDVPMKEIARLVGTSRPAVSQRLGTIHRIVHQTLAA